MQSRGRIQAIDGHQQRWQGTLGDVARLQVQVPELQRPLDEARVSEIVEYQRARIKTFGRPLFLGDIATLLADAQGRLWVVDGQHRLAAARTLVADESELAVDACVVESHPTTLLLVRGLTLYDAFELVNRAVPVPDWMVSATIDSAHRSTIRDAERLLRRRYGAFLSNATRPRPPNVQLNALTSALAAAAATRPRAFPQSAQAVLAFVEHANARMRDAFPDSAVSRAAAEKARARSVEPLFLANDGTLEFVAPWLLEFCDSHGPVEVMEVVEVVEVVEATKATKATKAAESTKATRATNAPIPKATRTAVWNRFFGVRTGVGTCQCCRREITQQDFECGHVIAASNGGAAVLGNLRPVCRTCNRSMGATNMDDFANAQGLLGSLAPERQVLSFHIDVEEDA